MTSLGYATPVIKPVTGSAISVESNSEVSVKVQVSAGFDPRDCPYPTRLLTDPISTTWYICKEDEGSECEPEAKICMPNEDTASCAFVSMSKNPTELRLEPLTLDFSSVYLVQARVACRRRRLRFHEHADHRWCPPA